MARIRVLLDCDPGVDDALAVALAFRSPELEVVALTTVSGNVPVEQATRNVRRILAGLAPAPVPVIAAGAVRPLERPPVVASSVHGADGLRRPAGSPRRWRTR